MKIAVVNTHVPFVRGGAEQLAEWLVDRLRQYGHQSDLVRLPYWVAPPQAVLENSLASHFARITGVDRVIALKFPCYYVPHEDKVLWVLHQHRPAYELWQSEFQQELPDTIEGRYVRSAIVQADNRLLREVSRVYCISQVIARRMVTFNGVEPRVLYPPVGDERSYYCEEPGRYVFFPSRVAPIKRQQLAVQAMRYVTSDVRLVIAGPGDMYGLSKLAADQGVSRRVELIGGWMPEPQKLELLARCLAVLFPPFDEDYGYVTLEGFLASKPVITCTDSGGPVELVEDGVCGWIAEPHPRALAEAIDELAADRSRAVRMGAVGRERARALGISWDHVVGELTASKIAWCTPVTGHEPAVEYSREVLAALAQLCEPVLCCNGSPEGFPTEIPVNDLAAAASQRRPDPWSLDAIFYMLGNDLREHAWIFEMSQVHPGIVVLRNRTLHPFFLAYYLDYLGRPDLYITRMAHHYGPAGLATAHRVIGPWFDSGAAPLAPEDTLRYTLTEEALRGASGVIADSGGHASVVRRLWSGPVHEASFPAEDERSAGDRSIVKYAEGLLRFAEGPAARVPADRLADAGSCAVAEQMAMHVGTTLGSLGAKPDSPEVEAVIREAARLLSPTATGQPRR